MAYVSGVAVVPYRLNQVILKGSDSGITFVFESFSRYRFDKLGCTCNVQTARRRQRIEQRFEVT